jgi:hypothetical protein
MSLQVREPLLANEEVLFKICEFGATTRVEPTTVGVDGAYKRPSRSHNARSKSRHLGFGICDHKTHHFSDERDPTFIGLLVALKRTEAELAEAKHTPS